LAIVDRLVLGDVSPTDAAHDLNLPSNLLAHHVNMLEDAGVLARLRSEGDHRRTYLRLLPAALADMAPATSRFAPKVVFVCTHNSARSQLAAALWAQESPVSATSAGTHPAKGVHPRAVAVAQRHGLSLSKARTAHIDGVVNDGDLVVAVCDNAHEELTTPKSDRLHWSIPDPARADTDDAFERTFHDIADRIGRLAISIRLAGADHD
jgi:protein-tyrosine-phosphatase